MDTTFQKYPDLHDYLNEFSKCITEGIDVQSIVLFGGITLDDFSVKFSDIDLVVVLKSCLNEEKQRIIEQTVTTLSNLNQEYTHLLYVYFLPLSMIESPSTVFQPHEGLIYGSRRMRSISQYPLSITDDFSIREKGQILYGEDMKRKFPQPPKDCFWKMFIKSLPYIEESSKKHPLQFSDEHNDNTTINLLLYFPRLLYSLLREDLIGKSDSAFWFQDEFNGSLGEFLIELAKCRQENASVLNNDELVLDARRLVLFTLDKILEFKGVSTNLSKAIDANSSVLDFQPLITKFKTLLNIDI